MDILAKKDRAGEKGIDFQEEKDEEEDIAFEL